MEFKLVVLRSGFYRERVERWGIEKIENWYNVVVCVREGEGLGIAVIWYF